mgnify:CR=1 FL=1
MLRRCHLPQFQTFKQLDFGLIPFPDQLDSIHMPGTLQKELRLKSGSVIFQIKHLTEQSISCTHLFTI